MAAPLLSLNADQQTSAVDKSTPQHDRWRAEEIAARRGQVFTLFVVADGEGQTAPGKAAELAVETAFTEARLRGDEPLPKLLNHLLTQMNEVIFALGSGDRVGVTLAAIQADGIWLIQAGAQTRAYRVRGERSASQLTSDNSLPLGSRQSLPGQVASTHRLKRGDKLVLCTDGLYAGDLVTPGEIAKIDRYREVKGAAPHLSALAMGRNVRDNVTVVVVAYGRKSPLTLRLLAWFIFASAAAGLIILMSVLGMLQFLRPNPRPPDYGVAVLAEGKAIQVEPLHIVYPGSDLSAAPDSPVHLNFKRRESLETAVTQTIPGIDLIFGPGAAFNLAAIDVQGFLDPAHGISQEVNLAEITLTEGQALLLSRNDHTFYVWPGTRENPLLPYAVLQGSPAALGVERSGSQFRVTCLAGSCSIHFGKEVTPIPAGAMTILPTGGEREPLIPLAPASEAELEKWLSLCRTWQADPESLPEACTVLVR